MSTGEDEPSPCLNGRLRPRRSTSTTTPSPRTKTIRKTKGKLTQDRPKRTSAPTKASLAKQDDLVSKSEAVPVPHFLCPYCDRKFNARQTASKHARRIHLSTSKQDNFIKCLYCNHSEAESNAIIKHMVDRHPNQYFACLDCHTRFTSTTELAEHKHNLCEKQKPPYRSKLRQKTTTSLKKNLVKLIKKEKTENPNGSTPHIDNLSFNGIVISCELKPSMHDAADIEDKITTNLILPSSKALGNATVERNALIVLDDLHWNKRIPPNFSFHNSDADQILSRLGVVHRSPRVGESRKDLIRMMDEPNEKFEKCFDTSFYSKVTKNVQENLAKFLDGTFNFNPNKDSTIKTRKSKASVLINTAEGFPILLAHEQFSRSLFDGFMPRAVAPKHKWKWDNTENDKNLVMLLDQTKRDSHVNNCIVTLISSLDIWTQLRMKSKFEEIFKTKPTAKKTEKQNIISLELKEILESRDIPSSSTYVTQQKKKPLEAGSGSVLCAYLGLSATGSECELKPAVLSGEWVRPRCYVCCACGDQTRDARTLSTHMATRHPNAQVQHYEIAGETLLSADILKHLYVPPSQMSNRTRPPRGFKDCTKCKKSITLEDLHQHMLDCAGDTPAVRRKCRYRPFGVRRRRPRLPDNMIRKKMRKHIRSRHGQKSHMRPRPRIRTEVGDAETIRKMIADLPAKRNRITPTNIVRPRRPVLKTIKQVKLRSSEDKKVKHRPMKSLNKPKKAEVAKKQNDTDNSSTIDEDDQPLKLSATRVLTRKGNSKDAFLRRVTLNKTKKKKQSHKHDTNMEGFSSNHYDCNTHSKEIIFTSLDKDVTNGNGIGQIRLHSDMSGNDVLPSAVFRSDEYPPHLPHCFSNQLDLEQRKHNHTDPNHHQIHREKLNVELADQVPHSQSALDSSHQRIDVKNAGSSNVRQYSNRDDNNMQNRKDRSAGGRDGSNQNNNIAQAPNGPLKHSIASLTSDTEMRDASMPYHYSCLLPPKANTTFVNRECGNDRNLFENEASVEKVDKPPLSDVSAHLKKMDEQQTVTDYSIAGNCSEISSLSELSGSRNPIVTAMLPNKPTEPRTANEQIFLQKDSIRFYESAQQSPYFEEDQTFVSKSPILKNSKDLVGLSLEHKTAHSNAETKIGADKTKSNKMRKLNDCIAMLQTKKGFRLDKAAGGYGDDENMDSELIDLETIDSEGTTTVGQNSSLFATKTTVEKAKKRKNMTPTHTVSGHDKDFSTSRNRCLSTEQVPAHSGKPYMQQNKVPIGNEHALLLKPNQHEGEFNLTKPSDPSESESKKLHLAGGMQMESFSDLSTRSKHSGDDNPDLSILQNMWRNSQGGIPSGEDLENFFYRNRVNQTVKTLIDFNNPNLTQSMLEIQSKLSEGKERNIESQLLHDYSHINITEMQKGRSIPETTVVADKAYAQEVSTSQPVVTTTVQAVATVAQPVSHIASTTEKFNNVKMTSRQSSVSPTSRRTRRKPIKKKTTLEQHPDFNSEQSLQQDRLMVSPLHHNSRGIGASPVDSNLGFAASSYMSAVSPSHEILALKTPPPPPPPNSISARRESCKRIRNNSETNTTIVENRGNVSLTTLVGGSPDTHAESIINMHNLRRNSIELANAQVITTKYGSLMAQAHRAHYEKVLMSISQYPRGISHVHPINPDGSNNDNTRFDKSNELHNHYSSGSTFVSVTQDTHGIMHVIPQTSSNHINKSSTRETQDHYKTSHENEQYNMIVNKQRSSTEAKGDHVMKVDEHLDKYSSHESKAYKPKSSLSIDTNSQKLTTRNTPETYYGRSSSYQGNIPKTSMMDRSLDEGYNENKETHDNAMRAYNESGRSAHSFSTPTVTYSNDMMHVQRNTISLISSCGPIVDEMAPLDLSCDTKSRKERTLHTDKKISDVSKNSCSVSISNKTHSDVSTNPSHHFNYGEILRNPLQDSLLSPENDAIEDPPPVSVEQHFFNESSQKSVKNSNQEMTTPKFTYQLPLPAASAQSANRTKAELSDRSLTNSSIKNIDNDIGIPDNIINTGNNNNPNIDQLQCLPPENNYFISQDSQNLSSIKQENKTIQVCGEEKSENEMPKKTPCVTANTVEDVAKEKNSTHGSCINMDHNLTSSKMPTESSNDVNNRSDFILNIKTVERNPPSSNHEEAISQENENEQIEQDAETARKIAMLPEELVKILGTIPKDHRNQLLNILPQYVSTPHFNVEKDTRKQNTSTSNDSNRLSVNTAISPSSVLPKKRHSPSHLRGRLNSSESQSSGSILPPEFVPSVTQRSPTGNNESENNTKCFQTDCSIKADDYGNNFLESTRSASKKDRIDIKCNDLIDIAHLSKTDEVLVPVETDHFPTISTDLTRKLPTKQRPSNEQTASLRAVRIKTTSTKKSFSDDKQLLTNYCYLTNIAIDEKKLNTGQTVSAENRASNINDLKYENTKLNQQMKNNCDTNETFRDTVSPNTVSIQDNDSKAVESVIISENKIENMINFINEKSQIHTESQNESHITLDDASNDWSQSNNVITLEQTSHLQGNNTIVESYAGQMKSTNCLTSTVPQDEVSAQKINVSSFDCELRVEESDDITSINKCKILEKTMDITENQTEQKCSYDNILLQPMSSTVTMNTDDKINNSFKDEESYEIFAKSLEIETKNDCGSSTKNEKSYEDDSEDDITLAVIKQKHHRTSSKMKKRTAKRIKMSAKQKSKDANSDRRNINNDNQVKKKSKRHKNKSKTYISAKITRHTEISDVTSNCELVKEIDVQMGFSELNDNNSINTNNILPTTTTNKDNEFNINKECNDTGSINNTDHNNKSLISLPRETENSLDNSDKSKRTSNTSAAMRYNLQPKIITELCTKSIKVLPELNVSHKVEIGKTCVSIGESQSQAKQTNSIKSDIKCSLSNVGCGNESMLLSSALNNTKPVKKSVKDLTDVSQKDSVKVDQESVPARVDSPPSDFQLCSEISEVNSMPLRRSRRGKSMYVDITYLDESEKIEDHSKKAPLTMKRLILSRVEKDKKRVSESSILDKSCDANDDHLLLTSKVQETSCAKKGKLTKRKTSPHSKRISKRNKPVINNEQVDDFTDFSNSHGTSENNSCILRELPNAENKITEKDYSNDDLKLRAVSEIALSLSENTTIVNNEKETDVASDILIESKESSTSVKRKNTTKQSDIVLSKPKKTKYPKKKPQSDFDSDDDKVLLETKRKIAPEKQLKNDYYKPKTQPTTSKDIEPMTCNVILKQTTLMNTPSDTLITCCTSDISNEDNNKKQSKSQPTTSKDRIVITCNDIPTQTANINSSSETRVTCYSRSILNRRPRFSSTTSKDHSNYDPYDIDFIDILESTAPIVKKKGRNANNSHSSKLHQDHKRYKRASVSKEYINKPSLEESKPTDTKIQPNTNVESDSDSSKSDVPLQKYVDEKISKVDSKNKKNKIDNESTQGARKIEAVSNQKCFDLKETLIITENTNNDNSKKYCSVILNADVSLMSGKNKRNTKRVTADESVSESEIPIKIGSPNTTNISVDQNTQKQSNKQKKTRHTPPVHNVESAILTNTEHQQLKSDKFMENFGFYSERIPRKSNLLASKKISETFHMICNDSDDSFFGYKEKSSRKSSSHESKKKSEIGSSLPIETSSNLHTETGSSLPSETDSNLVADIDCDLPTEISGNIPIEINSNLPSEIESNQPTEIESNQPTEIESNKPPEIESNQPTEIESNQPPEIESNQPTEIESNLPTETESNLPTETGAGVSQDARTAGDITNYDVQTIEPRTDIYPNESGAGDMMRIDDSDLDFLAAQAIMDSEEVRSLENDLFSSLREAAEASAARHCFVGYQNTSDVDTTPKDVYQNDSYPHIEDKNIENTESNKKCNKSKQNKQPGVKDKMYPDIEEIDMFEDKFDKIKRKRRSQAVAAKQVQIVAETSSSGKSRKQVEKKKNTKSIKRKYQSTQQVPTKGALKGFEGIKISIPTHDLNMPIIVSPPRQSKKRRKTTSRRRKETSDSDSSCSEFDDKDKSVLDRDIYEFKESEDAELFDLRPSTVMDRFRSMYNKNKYKHKDKDRKESEKVKSKEKDRKSDVKNSSKFDTMKEKDKYNEREKVQKKYISKEHRRAGTEKDSQRAINYGEKNFEESMYEDSCMKTQKGSEAKIIHGDDNNEKEMDDAVASTSGLARDRIDESDYESEMSSPEGDFIVYMSNDINCVCASDNDSDDSDAERGCGRLNCLNKNRNADKNAAIENIFKNNAVRCEKPDLIKEPEPPRPDLDQLFDSLLVTKPNNNENQKEISATSNTDLHKDAASTSSLPVAQYNLIESKDLSEDHTSLLNQDIKSNFDKSYATADCYQLISRKHKNILKNDERTQDKSDSDMCKNDILTDSSSMQMYTYDDKSKENLGYSLMSEESTQVNYADIIAQSRAANEVTNDEHLANVKTTKASSQLTKYNSEDEFDINKPETLNRHYMHLVLPAEKVSVCAQTENNIDEGNEESVNESAATKYLKGLSAAEAADMEIYTMVSAQSTQTDKTKRNESGPSKYDDISQSKSEDEEDMPGIPRSRIRLRKYDICGMSHKSNSTKSIQTDKSRSYRSCHYEDQEESDDDVGKTDICKRADKETNLAKINIKGCRASSSNSAFLESNDKTPAEDDAFMAPASRTTMEKHSPRKSDEGISTSHDYSADAFEHSFDNAGVAHQRARRKCTVGKQNVLAEHWSSESEFDGAPPRPNSADSVIASAPRKKKSRKKEGHHTSGKKASRYLSKKEEGKVSRGRTASGARSEEGEAPASGRPPPGPKMRARAAHYWSSEGEESIGPQPQHGWIVGDSHKKLVTMLAHAKGRKRNNADKHLD